MLVVARARRSPRRWLAPGLGIAVTAGFAGAVGSEGVIVGDRAARAVLSSAAPADRVVRLTWQGPLTPVVVRQARRVLAQPGLGRTTQVLELDPVRVGGIVVRLVAISPLARWLPSSAVRDLGRCRPADCPMVFIGGGRVPTALTMPGLRIRLVGAPTLSSAVPLGFVPAVVGQGPVLATDDLNGLNELPALSGVYRTYNWVAPLHLRSLHSWTLKAVEARLQRSQAELSSTGGQFMLTAPFTALASARAQASAAPRRLALVGGGVLVSLLLFVVLAAVGLRTEQRIEIERLRAAGGRPLHGFIFVLAEATWVCSLALVVGYALATCVASIEAGEAGEPVGAILAHSLLSPGFVFVAVGIAVAAAALLAAATLVRGWRVLDAVTVIGVTALVVGLVLGRGSGNAWDGLLVPLCCLAAGLLLFRVMALLFRAGDTVTRRASVTMRLAFLSLARAGGPVAAAVAFLGVSTALAGFALSFRATLARGTADQAADRVPLDALVAPGPSFVTPLELSPLARWRKISHGEAFPVRRTVATFAGGSTSVTVPILGVPTAALVGLHGWRASDGSAPLAVLARRLQPHGRFRSPGPVLPQTARWLRLDIDSPRLDLLVTADLRDGQGLVRQLPLGSTATTRGFVQAELPRGRWELEAFKLDESTGLASTDAHQLAENPAPATQFAARLSLGPLLLSDAHRHLVLNRSLGNWRGVGAVSSGQGSKAGAANVVFQTSGAPGVIRPVQPSDYEALPVLADPGTAALAGPRGRIGLTVDNLPVEARVVGTIKRFPTTGPGTAGFIVADQPALSDALDAQLPGQGRPDEIWISTSRPSALQAGLTRAPLSQLTVSFRGQIEHELRHQPLVVGVMGTLLAAGAITTTLAVLGMVLLIGGAFRDRTIERDLEAQGLGPSTLRRELRLRLTVAVVLGVWPGLVIAVLIDRLAVAFAGTVESASPQPPLITVVPWSQLIALGVTITGLCLIVGWLATAGAFRNRRAHASGAVASNGARYTPVEDFGR